MIIYIDADFKCHVADDGTMTAVETDAFDGKCDAYIEGYRYVPAGESWTRPDGVVFSGEMITPWKHWQELDAAQTAYERQRYSEMAAELEDMKTALNTLGVTVDG